jgi:WD40 repeat protein
MGRKDFQKGMEAGAKPFEKKFKRQAEAIDRVSNKIEAGIKKIDGVVEEVIDGLSSIEKKQLYDLNTQFDINKMEDYEKELLLAILFTLAEKTANENQQAYIRSVKKYLNITNPQTQIDICAIENIENLITQKTMFQTFSEFLFLKNESDSFFKEYADFFDNFSVKQKDRAAIFNNIIQIYNATGAQGICEKYGYVADAESDEITIEEKIIIPDRIEKSIETDCNHISPDGKYLAMIIQEDDRQFYLQIMDTESEDIIYSIVAPEKRIMKAVSPDGNYIVINDYLINLQNGEKIDLDIEWASFSWDNKLAYVVNTESDTSLNVFDLQNKNLLLSSQCNIEDGRVEFSPDNSCFLYSPWFKNMIVFYDANNGNELYNLTDDMGVVAQFSYDGKYFLTIDYNNLQIRYTKNGKVLDIFEFEKKITCACISPNGKTIAVALANKTRYTAEEIDGEIKIINSETGEELQQIPTGDIGAMSFSKNGKKLIIIESDGTDYSIVKFLVGE